MASTFQKFHNTIHQSNYIQRKKYQCKKTCIQQYPISCSYNKKSINAGLYYVSNLQNVCSVINQPMCEDVYNCDKCKDTFMMNVDMSSGNWTTEPFVNEAFIDPIGNLFGKNQCGELNYTFYMEPKILNT